MIFQRIKFEVNLKCKGYIFRIFRFGDVAMVKVNRRATNSGRNSIGIVIMDSRGPAMRATQALSDRYIIYIIYIYIYIIYNIYRWVLKLEEKQIAHSSTKASSGYIHNRREGPHTEGGYYHRESPHGHSHNYQHHHHGHHHDQEPTIVSQSGNVRVREIWVGNLPSTITERTLYSHFFIYGEIENIEIVARVVNIYIYIYNI